MVGQVQALLRRAWRVDRTRIQVRPAAAHAAVVGGCLAIGIAIGQPAAGLTASFGALMTGIQDQGPTFPQRVRSVAIGLLINTAAALLAVLVGQDTLLLVAAAALVAFFGGSAPMWGPVLATAGSAAVKTFAIMAAVTLSQGAIAAASAYALGGMAQICLILGIWAIRGGGDVRPAVAKAWSDLGRAVGATPTALEWTAVRVSIDNALASADAIPKGTRYADLQRRVATRARDVERSAWRTAEGDANRRPPLPDEYRATVAHACHEISQAVVHRSAVASAYAAVQEVIAATDDPATSADRSRIGRALVDSELAIRQLHRTQGRERHQAAPLLPPLLAQRRKWSWSSPIVGQAVRLAVMLAVAELLARVSGLPHEAWIPMTVAVVSVAGYAASLTRLTSRLAGSVVAVVLFQAAYAVFPSPPQPILLVLFAGAAFVYLLAFFGNYAIATFAITTYVLLNGEIQGAPTTDSGWVRLLATFVGGAIVLIGTSIHPLRSSSQLANQLADYADALSEYWQSLAPETSEDERAAAAQRCRSIHVKTDVIVDETFAEPRPKGLDPTTAAEVLRCLGQAALAGTDVADGIVGYDAIEADATAAALGLVARRLRSPGTPVTPDDRTFPAVRRALDSLAADTSDAGPTSRSR